ncbi:arabinofuranan 3-O-arabinosyltransferase [Haloactinopolyspora alba]|uniref:Arabinofuranan 3-O-arabinosyltransferase n=1 Tax=Haloactinopolyspora alba TaxID=648780 RepID=A0A2P8E3N0_9ACTN|nr:alpha-(1->3)-arabinofuranosyltransferase [Haloactinopolyspora alba]PSL04071.1 arabinofuranan 3-O-arabinosyltransferase [Haloactinopolyspora alba]
MTVEPSEPARHSVTAWRLWLTACASALVVLAFRQQPGRIVPDTKLDLTADPGGFLGRALHLWEPAAAFGQLQNQAYGYLFPMGPFHLLGELAAMPAWVIQRAWWSLIMVVAFAGMLRLATQLGVGRPWTRLLGAMAFALTPRILVSLGAVSIEAWPTALAPWILVPLVRAHGGGAVVRNAAASALAVACIGGVNAAATAAAVVPAGLWLVLAPRWRGRLRFAAWWVGCTLVATVWWWGPLLLLGSYSPPFLDWIETAANTTQHTSLVEVARGSDHWLSYLGGADGPQWPAGWLLASEPVLILDTMLVAALGLAGLARLDMPARRVLLTGAVAGLALVSAGYAGSAASPLAEQVRALLDGPLAPLRNVHKFDVVLRIPLVLGLTHVLAMLPRVDADRRFRVLATGLAVVVLAGVAVPALAGRLPQPGSYERIPQHWREASAWLDENAGTGRALLVPGSAFAEYAWGSPRDEPVQALADSRWAVRDSVPLSSAGNIRLLDAVETRLAAGEGGAGVVRALRRAGVAHLVVRNDLRREGTSVPRASLVHQALADLPGAERVAAFGPRVGPRDRADTAVDSRLDTRYPAVEIYRIADPDRELRVRAHPLHGSMRMSGGPESLLTVGDAGLLDERAVFVAGDGASVPDPSPVPVVTDGLRRRAVWFGATRNNETEVLRAGDDGPLDRAVRDFLPVDDPARETVAVVDGVAGVTASSSGSDPLATLARGAEHSPWSAVDGDPATSWVSGEYGHPEGQWLEIEFERPRTVDTAELVPVDDGPVGAPVTRVAVETDTGTVETALHPDDDVHELEVPPGRTSRLRVRAVETGPGTPTGVGIRELRVPGLSARKTLRAPPVRGDDLGGPGTAETLVFATADGARRACVRTGERSRCAPQLERVGEENGDLRRRAETSVAATYTAEATVRPRPGTALTTLLEPDAGALRAEASSRAVDDPPGRPQAAVDLDRGTGWVAAPGDETPVLALSWDEPRRIDGVRIAVGRWLAASRPSRVELTAGGERHTVDVGDDGRALLPEPVETTGVEIRFLELDEVVDTDTAFGLRSALPAGASEVEVLGTDELREPVDGSEPVELACGSGPRLVVDGATMPTELSGTVDDLLRGGRLDVRSCGEAETFELEPGTHDITLAASPATRPEALTVRPVSADRAEPAEPLDVHVRAWSQTHRRVAVPERDTAAVLTVTENMNDGWTASLDGTELEPVRVDGWAQGYVLPAGAAGVVELTYRPDTPYRAALGTGAAGATLIAVLWWRAPRTPPWAPAHGGARAGGRHGARRRRAGGGLRVIAGTAAAVAALGLLGGVAGLAAAGLGAAVGAAARRWSRLEEVVPVLAGGAALAAGAVVALRPWPGPDPGAHSAGAQVLMLVALALATLGPRQSVLLRRRT